ncbi:MAG: FHA domain-containing protein [Planctomycetes bacterium]|nr:FHA domain-containing protein [Planctomycetota bacterium]
MADSRSSPVLQVTQGPDIGRTHPIQEGVTLGRIPSCGVVLTDPAASRQHARISRTPQGYIIEDLQSANGTYVNDQRVTKSPLNHGDLIRICRLEFSFLAETPAGSGEPSPAGAGPAAPSGTAARPTDEILFGKDRFFTSATASGTAARPTSSVGRRAGRAAVSPADETRMEGEVGQTIIHSFVEVRQDNLAKDIRSARSEEEWQRISHRFEIINDVSNKISTILDLNDLLNSVMDRLFEVFPSAERGYVLMIDAAKNNELVPKVVKPSELGKDSELQYSTTIVQRAILDKHAILVSDAAQDDRFDSALSIMKYNIRSSMCVPLICQNEVLGIINIDTTRLGNRFKEEDLKLLTAIASPIATAVKNAQLVKEKEAEVTKRASLQRYFSPNVVDKIVKGQLTSNLGGERRKGIAFFSDIVGFTKMASRVTAERVVQLLNSYFDVMVEILFRHQATIDKFSGDAIMAVWGAPEALENAEWHAVQAALEMQNALFEFNCNQLATNVETVEMGIGVNYGSFIAGNMGASGHQVNYTIIGEDVNLAARIEARAGRGQVFISESAYERVRSSIGAVVLPATEVKGIPYPITIYSVRAVRPIGEDADTSQMLTSLPVEVTLSEAERVQGCLIRAKRVPPGQGALLDLLVPRALTVGLALHLALKITELKEVPVLQAVVVELIPRETGGTIPQVARVNVESLPSSLQDLLTMGEPAKTSVEWKDLVR